MSGKTRLASQMQNKILKRSSISLSLVALLSCYTLVSSAQDSINAMSKFNVRITKENFAEFSDSLVIKEPLEHIQLDKFFEKGVNIDDLSYIYDSILKLDKEKPPISMPKIEHKAVMPATNSARIYNVSLSGEKPANSIINSPMKFSPALQSNALITRSISKEDVKAIIESSRKLIVEGNKNLAETRLDKAVLNSQNDSWMLAEIAGLFEQIYKFKKASVAYQRAVLLNPKRIELLYSYALCLGKLNQLDKAENVLLKVTSIDPKFTLAYYNLGNIYYKQAQYYKALEYYNKSIKLNPLCTDAYYNAAITLEVLSYEKLAYRYYLKCIELKPDDMQAHKAADRLRKA